MENGYVRNCYLQPKNNEILFTQRDDGSVIATLDGYAVIPKDVHERLLKMERAVMERHG